MADVWANSMACHPRATCHIAGCCHLTNLMSWSLSCVSHCRVLPPGEFNGMSPRATYHITGCCHLVNSLSWFQSHMPHCRVKSMSWSCHIAGCKNSIRRIKNRFRYILFILFFNAVGALTSGGFRIVSDTLVLSSERSFFIFYLLFTILNHWPLFV